jgi:Haem-NO-binding
MYGMVNNAIRLFVIENHGAETWQQVCQRTGVDPGEFAAVLPYDDSVSLDLIAQASARTGLNMEELLRRIGRYWVHFAATSAFGPLIAFGGTNFEEFLGNLDAMHSKIKSSLPKLAPPSFRVERQNDGNLRVTYRSCRDGLFPFVEGLFEGLSDHFGQSVDILGFECLGPGQAQWILHVGDRDAQLSAA